MGWIREPDSRWFVVSVYCEGSLGESPPFFLVVFFVFEMKEIMSC